MLRSEMDTADGGGDQLGGWWLAGAVGCFVFVAGAVTVEVLAGMAANSPVPAWAERWVPLAWPRWARALWWLVVAAAAAGFRLSLARLGMRQRAWIVLASVAPFVAFSLGIAAGADWATWH